MSNIDRIINESIENYLSKNLVLESSDEKKSKDSKETKDDETNHRFKKKAIKTKGSGRKDFDVKDDEIYNKNVDDLEQTSVEDILKSGFINIKKVGEKLYPDHTPEGAQSQLNKKLRGDKSDSGSTYRLKNKEVKKLRQIIANYLNI